MMSQTSPGDTTSPGSAGGVLRMLDREVKGLSWREETHGEVTLTVGEVGRRQAVAEEHAVGLGHLQVDHVGGVLQRRDGLLVAHLLQPGAVHLHAHTPLQCGSVRPARRARVGVASQRAACPRSAACRPCARLRPR